MLVIYDRVKHRTGTVVQVQWWRSTTSSLNGTLEHFQVDDISVLLFLRCLFHHSNHSMEGSIGCWNVKKMHFKKLFKSA